MNSRQSSPRSSFPSQRHRKQRELPRYDVRNVINRKRASKNGNVRSRSPKSVSRSKSRSRSRSRPRISKKNSSRSPPRRSPPRRSPPRRSTPMRSRSRNRHCDQIEKQFVYFTFRILLRRFKCKLKGLMLISVRDQFWFYACVLKQYYQSLILKVTAVSLEKPVEN